MGIVSRDQSDVFLLIRSGPAGGPSLRPPPHRPGPGRGLGEGRASEENPGRSGRGGVQDRQQEGVYSSSRLFSLLQFPECTRKFSPEQRKKRGETFLALEEVTATLVETVVMRRESQGQGLDYI